MKLNDHREPRFYAWISFHNGFYECQTENVVADGTKGITYQDKMDRSDRKQRKRWLTQYKKEDNSGKMNRGNNYSPTGYLNKKGVHPGSAARKSDNVPSLRYPLPIIRLGELYLDYAEACVGYGDASYVAEGMKKAGAEVGLFELDKIDEAFVAEAKAVVFGAPTFYADTCWQMKKFFDETKLPLAGKIGATFGTAGYLQGGCEIALQNNVVRMLCKGMLVYSGGCALGEPLTHLGAIALGGHVEEQKEQFVTLGERVAAQAARL